MSAMEMCMQMLHNVPEYKLGYVMAFLQGLTADESADDAFCMKLVEEYEADPEKDVAYDFDDCMREWGLA